LGKITLANTDPASGTTIANIQTEVNAQASFSGVPVNSAVGVLPTWTNNQGLVSTDNLKERSDALSGKFNSSTGHAHDGSLGNGTPITSANIANTTLMGFILQGTLLTGVSGGSTNVSTELTGKFPSSGSASLGVVTTTPYNLVALRQGSGVNKGDKFTDLSGNEVHGRITESSLVWTLTYVVDIAGVETPYSFATSVDVDWYYQQLFNPIVNSPVYNPGFFVPSDNATADVLDATETQRGVVSTGAQNFGGDKTFFGNIFASANNLWSIGTIANKFMSIFAINLKSDSFGLNIGTQDESSATPGTLNISAGSYTTADENNIPGASVNITAGGTKSWDGAFTNGLAGNINITAGSGSGANPVNGGNISIYAGDSTVGLPGGYIDIVSGAGGDAGMRGGPGTSTTPVGGDAIVTGGFGFNPNGTGGNGVVEGGQGFDSGSGGIARLKGGRGGSSGTGGAVTIQGGTGGTTGTGGNIQITSGDSQGGLDSGFVQIVTSNSAASTTGDVSISTGTTSGARGKIQLIDGSQGTVGHVWTSIDTSGKGGWASTPASGANVTLSNLTNPTAINQDLIFDKASVSVIRTKDQTTINSYGTELRTGDTSFIGGNSGPINLFTGQSGLNGLSGSVVVQTGGINGNGFTGNVGIITGDAISGNASTGTIYLQTGLKTGTGARGKIKFVDGSEGTIGHVWKSIDALGNGGWASAGSSTTFNKENLTLSGTDITNQYKDLAQVIIASSLDLVVSGLVQTEGTDYSVSLTGGAGGKTRITFLGDLATGGGAALVAGDILHCKYNY